MNGSSQLNSVRVTNLGDHSLRLHPNALPRPRSTYNMSNQTSNEWRREVIDLDHLRSPLVGHGLRLLEDKEKYMLKEYSSMDLLT